MKSLLRLCESVCVCVYEQIWHVGTSQEGNIRYRYNDRVRGFREKLPFAETFLPMTDK